MDAEGVLITDPSAVVEGTEMYYRYAVNNAPQGALTLSTTLLGDVVIADGTTYTDVLVPNRADDLYDQGSLATTADVTGWSGGNYENLVHTDTADATIVDDNDPSTVMLVSTASVDVGGLITYTATVNNAPLFSPLVITIVDENTTTLGQITINPGEFEGTLVVAAPDAADESYDVSIDSATGGTYEALDITDGASTVISGIPASSALMITNSNSDTEQSVRVTIASNHGSNSTGVIELTDEQGQEVSALTFDDEVVFEPGQYNITIEHVSGDPIILTDLSITDSHASELSVFEGNVRLETGDTGGNTNFDGYIIHTVIGPDFGTDSTDFTVDEPIGYEVLGGILTLDTESNTSDFTLDLSELSINGGENLFGDSVETINISGKGTGEDNTLIVSPQNVLDLGEVDVDESINIVGDTGDVVQLVDTDAYANTVWQQVDATDTYVFMDTSSAETLATLIVNDDVTVDIID